MGRFLVSGGKRLSGELRVCGAKNAALPIFAASLLTDEHVRLYDCPEISDADNMLEILATLGCKVQRDGNTVDIDCLLYTSSNGSGAGGRRVGAQGF